MDFRTVSLAAQSYSQAKTISPTAPGDTTSSNITKAAQSFSNELQKSEAVVMENMISGADPHALVQALAETELAIETAVTVRNKVVEAYQEILRMPV